jgi:hypothetical protein
VNPEEECGAKAVSLLAPVCGVMIRTARETNGASCKTIAARHRVYTLLFDAMSSVG